MESKMNDEDLIAQGNRVKEGMRRRAAVYEEVGLKLEPMSHVNLWRHATRLTHLLTEATLVLVTPIRFGPTMNEWRHKSDKAAMVTRIIMREFATRREPLTQSRVVEMVGSRASVSTTKTVLNDGINLKLLRRVKGGYIPTELAIDESFERGLCKILQPSLVEFCRFVVSFHDSRENNLRLLDLEERKALHTDKEMTIQEKLYYER
jgi:hypothetical protein